MAEAAPPIPDLDALLARLEAQLGSACGRPRPLEGGITNRNYRVSFAGEEFVVRLPGKDTDLLGISREAERLAGEAAADLGISPEPVAMLPECTVTRFVPCSRVSAEELRADPREIALALRAFHERGPTLPTTFDVPRLLGQYASVVAARGASLPRQYEPTVAAVHAIATAVADRADPPVPCHNDLLAANVIRASSGASAGRLLLVDWEYAGMGDRFFDLGNLSVNNGFRDEADELLLEAYLDRAPARRDRARLRLMRVMSDAREAAWGVVQGAVSELDFDFAAYAHEHFDRLSAATDSPRFEQWLHDARS